jgi:hypothetical protein
MTAALPLAALFRAPPDQFTAVRNRLVAELRRAGDTSAAAAISRLPRPTVVVWAINQAAHDNRAAVHRLLTTADQLKRAQLGRAVTDVPVSAKAYQEAVAALVEKSLAHVADTSHPATAAARNRLTGTLLAAATDPALREQLREGRLTREHTAAGFDIFGDAPPALRAVKPSAASPLGSRRAVPVSSPPEDREALRRRTEAGIRLETARAGLARAESHARELAETAVELAQGAVEARQRAAAARRAVAQSRVEVARARARVTAAEKAAKDQ